MSEATFTGEGFKPFPNTHSDRLEASTCVEWDTDRLEYKINEYGEFLQCEDIMARARRVGNEVLDLLIFELACREGVYDAE